MAAGGGRAACTAAEPPQHGWAAASLWPARRARRAAARAADQGKLRAALGRVAAAAAQALALAAQGSAQLPSEALHREVSERLALAVPVLLEVLAGPQRAAADTSSAPRPPPGPLRLAGAGEGEQGGGQAAAAASAHRVDDAQSMPLSGVLQGAGDGVGTAADEPTRAQAGERWGSGSRAGKLGTVAAAALVFAHGLLFLYLALLLQPPMCGSEARAACEAAPSDWTVARAYRGRSAPPGAIFALAERARRAPEARPLPLASGPRWWKWSVEDCGAVGVGGASHGAHFDSEEAQKAPVAAAPMGLDKHRQVVLEVHVSDDGLLGLGGGGGDGSAARSPSSDGFGEHPAPRPSEGGAVHPHRLPDPGAACSTACTSSPAAFVDPSIVAAYLLANEAAVLSGGSEMAAGDIDGELSMQVGGSRNQDGSSALASDAVAHGGFDLSPHFGTGDGAEEPARGPKRLLALRRHVFEGTVALTVDRDIRRPWGLAGAGCGLEASSAGASPLVAVTKRGCARTDKQGRARPRDGLEQGAPRGPSEATEWLRGRVGRIVVNSPARTTAPALSTPRRAQQQPAFITAPALWLSFFTSFHDASSLSLGEWILFALRVLAVLPGPVWWVKAAFDIDFDVGRCSALEIRCKRTKLLDGALARLARIGEDRPGLATCPPALRRPPPGRPEAGWFFLAEHADCAVQKYLDEVGNAAYKTFVAPPCARYLGWLGRFDPEALSLLAKPAPAVALAMQLQVEAVWGSPKVVHEAEEVDMTPSDLIEALLFGAWLRDAWSEAADAMSRHREAEGDRHS
ncbi:unnamed protein product [Prorocentrum cordatum]|uniref:Uncharacterized protein n=1 Tax=Prorocentrum cordatum TaxID=2364126 RepID=A0ABN9RTF1_9DINO|nr:unnamed protein product [Polarella glacialis]